MKKQCKLLAVLSATAFMAAVTPDLNISIPGFVQNAQAAVKAGWVEEDGEMRYQDSDGYFLTDTWKKRDNEWYYLDENGYITRSSMVDEYYVDEDGKRIYNQWIGVANDEEWDDQLPENFWYYYGKDGKSIVSQWQTIEGKDYYFNEEGHMQTGLLELDGYVYYLGDENDGTKKTGWIQLENENEALDQDMVWHYFDTKGRMVMNQVDRKIDGNYYTFENGVLQTGWYRLPETNAAANADASESAAETDTTANAGSETADAAGATANADEAGATTDAGAGDAAETTAASDATSTEAANSTAAAGAAAPAIASYQYYEADGKRAEGWYQIEGAPGISEEGEIYTFYFKKGRPHHASSGVQTFNIDSRRHAFNTNGEMQTGLQVLTLEDGTTANAYFGTDGVMKTGKQTIYNEDLGENQTWFFLTDGGKKGHGFHGIRDNSVYNQGLRMDADRDLRYAPADLDGTKYLVNASGSIQKASSSSKSASRPELGKGFKDVKDDNDKTWTVDVNGVIQQ